MRGKTTNPYRQNTDIEPDSHRHHINELVRFEDDITVPDIIKSVHKMVTQESSLSDGNFSILIIAQDTKDNYMLFDVPKGTRHTSIYYKDMECTVTFSSNNENKLTIYIIPKI